MNRDEAKTILSIYRPGIETDGDPRVAEALELAGRDSDLAAWLEEHCERQRALSAAFRNIAVPQGLKEQIISEHKAKQRQVFWRRNAFVASAALAGLLILAALLLPARRSEDTFAVFRSRMISAALRGYAMDLVSTNAAEIRTYLARNNAPADYVLPAPLQQTEVSGCAVKRWNGAQVSMICFRTGKRLPPEQQSDLWLFVIDRDSVREAPDTASAELVPTKGLITAVWTHGGKLYLLGTAGDERAIRQFL